jgi:sulfate/thiosulfate-binding protein
LKRVGLLVSIVMGVVLLGWAFVALAQPAGGDWLLHVSYDPTRELYRAMNKAFSEVYFERHGKRIVVRQSHSGSASQARAVNEGLPADVVSLAIQPDLDAVAATGLVGKDWRERLPHQATPFHSTIVFVVRKGNTSIRDWPDLVRSERPIKIVTPNPKTSGNGKLSLLAAWGAAIRRGCADAEAEAVLKTMFARVPVWDASARAATATFAQKNIGDVHLTFESEAVLEVAESRGSLEVVHPASGSLRVEPPIAWVDRTVRRRETESMAKEYLVFIFSPAGQRIGAELSYRPSDPSVAAEFAGRLPVIPLFTLQDVGLDWENANKKFFASGAMFDRIAAEVAGSQR